MRNKIWLVSLPILALSACVTLPNVRKCAVAGTLSAGMNCAETISHVTSEMTLDETLFFLEPEPEASGQPKKGPAVCMSLEDATKEQTALEAACRELGPNCKLEKVLKRGQAIRMLSGEL